MATISGSLGSIGANAAVFFLNTADNPDFNPNVVSSFADGSGDYVSPDLAPGTYLVTPALFGMEFSPFNSSQTVASSNITGVDFGFGSFYSLQPGGSDAFNYSGDLDVQNSTDWKLDAAGDGPIVAENGFAQGTDDEFSVENWIGPGYTSPYTGDVWASIVLRTSDADTQNSFVIGLRADSAVSSFGIWLEWFTNSGLGTPTAAMDILDIADQTLGLFLSDNTLEFNAGDEFLCVARGSNYYLFQNRIAIGAVTFPSTTPGFTSLIQDVGDLADTTTIQNWQTGAVVAGASATDVDHSADFYVAGEPLLEPIVVTQQVATKLGITVNVDI